jgi:hypothetical protein
MPTVPLTTAVATYGHTKALKDGAIQSERVTLEHRDVSPITSAFRQMVHPGLRCLRDGFLHLPLRARVSQTYHRAASVSPAPL